jgi:Icc-related predicted phosphoesterase
MSKLKINLLSDIHLEVSDFTIFHNDADVIVLAGDIAPGFRLVNKPLFRRLQDHQHVIAIDGNHEFYHHDINDLSWHDHLNATPDGFKKRMHHLKNEEVVIHGVRFLGTTIWTDYELFGREMKKECMADCAMSLSDHRLIRNGKWDFTPDDALSLHNRCVDWLAAKQNEPFDGPTVVVTHHAPSPKSVAKRFEKDPVSAGFASNLEHLMDPQKVQLWVHGHMHASSNYVVNGVHVVCNPRGYARFDRGQENFDFDPTLLIEIDTETRSVCVSGNGKLDAKKAIAD